MRKALLAACLLSPLYLLAWKNDSVLHRIDMQLSFVYHMPTGQYSARSGSGYLLGQSRSGIGGDLLILSRVVQNFHAGLYVQNNHFRLDNGKIAVQLQQRFYDPGFYTTTSISRAPDWQMLMSCWGMEFSNKFRLKIAEFEPFLEVGVGNFSENYLTDFSVRRKMKNDNYSQNITLTRISSNNFFYPGIGLRLNKQLHKFLYASIGFRYNYGVMKYSINYVKSDFLNNYTFEKEDYTQHVSCLQAEIGFQMRIFKAKRFRHFYRRK